jgi:hypothetical protein
MSMALNLTTHQLGVSNRHLLLVTLTLPRTIHVLKQTRNKHSQNHSIQWQARKDLQAL